MQRGRSKTSDSNMMNQKQQNKTRWEAESWLHLWWHHLILKAALMILLLGYTDRKGVTQTVEQVHELFLSKLMYRPLKKKFIIYFLLKHLQLNKTKFISSENILMTGWV